MYIISKKKDYYDGVVGSVGMDKTIIYERKPNEIVNSVESMPDEFKSNLNYSSRYNKPFLNISYFNLDTSKSTKYNDVESFIIGFCGKIYIGWKFYYKVKTYPYYSETKCDYVYDFDIAKKYITEEHWSHKLIDDINYVMNYDPINIFRKLNSPIFVLHSFRNGRVSELTVNPLLKEYEFYKVIDAFTAFTELQMFISGVLGTGENDIVVIEDKYKIKKHGFDKWSFRKEPQKK